MMIALFKKLFIPSGQKVPVTAYETWVVRWVALKNDWQHGYEGGNPQVEVFTSEADAKLFANQLKEAFRLLRYGGERLTKISVSKNQ